jgi:hypothetical protein
MMTSREEISYRTISRIRIRIVIVLKGIGLAEREISKECKRTFESWIGVVWSESAQIVTDGETLIILR